MLIIGCDYHPSVQQIAFVDTETGECQERRLSHCAEAEQFYRELKQRGIVVRLGMEATGQSRWFISRLCACPPWTYLKTSPACYAHAIAVVAVEKVRKGLLLRT